MGSAARTVYLLGWTTWGLCHINPDGGGSMNESILARFDCDLIRDVDWPDFKSNNLRHEASVCFQRRLVRPDTWRRRILEEQPRIDRNTIVGGKTTRGGAQ